MTGDDQHVFKSDQEMEHNLDSPECPCGPEIIRQGPEDGLVIVHKDLSA